MNGASSHLDRFAVIQAATRAHRADHGCGAYTFEDGLGLRQLAAHWQPRRVLELGTALGYTACCLADGILLAHLDTIEADADHVKLARLHIAQSGLGSRVTVHRVRFEDLIRNLDSGYDMIFFDGFAPDPSLTRDLHERLVAGGLLICSNLQLASEVDTRALRRDLDDPARWRREEPIERGATQVRVKSGA